MYTYAWYHWLTFFYIYCFFGWVFESVYVSCKEKRFVNRGFLRLPMLPLYGTGAIMLLWLCLPFKELPWIEYFVGALGATVLEYGTGYVMELLFKVRYWDYSDKKYNLNGYICLSSTIAWGFLTIFMTDVIHRPIEHLVLTLPPMAESAFLGCVSAAFCYDTYYSTREALNFARVLASITKLRAELNELQVQLALLKAETTQNVANFRDTFRENINNVSGSISGPLENRRNALSEALAEKRTALQNHMTFHRPGILRRNPGAASRTFASALKDLRASWEAHKPG